jgi:hypothetical protein
LPRSKRAKLEEQEVPVLKNPRHETFAQYLAQGKTQDEAYKLAGFKPSRGNASHLSDKQSIRDRVHQLTTKIVTKEATATAKKAAVTLESLVEMQKKLYDKAYDTGQLSPGVAAAKEISVLTGHRVERAEIGAPGEFDALTDEELERALIEHLSELGLTADALDADSDTKH